MTAVRAMQAPSVLVTSAVRSGARLIATEIARAERVQVETQAPCVGLLVLPSGAMPEGVVMRPSPGGCHVGAVSLARATELVEARSIDGAGRLSEAPSVGNRWCVVIGATSFTFVPLTLPRGEGSDG